MTLPYDPIDGMLIEVEFRCPGILSAPTAPVTLLIDTGARRTHVTSQIADFLGLSLRTRVRIRSATNVQLVDCWSADIVIPALQKTFSNWMVVDFLQPTRNYAGVLGRDILCLGTLQADGPNGTATISF